MGDPVKWYDLDVQPEPWEIGPLSVVRVKGKDGKMKVIPKVGRSETLHGYQMAVKDALTDQGATDVSDRPHRLVMFFWRNTGTYTSHQARAARSQEADVTNLIKATEDACHGIFYKNDKVNIRVEGFIVRQDAETEPRVLIGVDEVALDEPYNCLKDMVPAELLVPKDQPTLLDDPDEARWTPPEESNF